MEIKKIRPQGFCRGVICAIKKINDTLKENTYEKPLYMLGGIVHNKHIINAYLKKGIKVIKYEDLENINSGSIIITAHGLSEKKKEYIRQKGLNIVDTTCLEVNKIDSIIKEKSNNGYTIIYYGIKNHPECKAIMENNDDIILINKDTNINDLDIKNNKLFFASQTTVSYLEVEECFNTLKERYPYIEKITDICNATKNRQLAIINSAKDFDMIIIIGDKMSNNTKMLVNIASLYTKAILIENIEDVNNINFDNIKKLGISAGASTPNILVDEVIKKILDKTHSSILEDDDYINI